MEAGIQMKRLLRTIICLPLIGILSACVSRDIGDLENKVAEIMDRKSGGRIDPLPEIKPYEAYAYKSGQENAPNPFKLFYMANKPKINDKANIDDGLTEEMGREVKNRNREELEQFELDSLRMVGTINDKSNNWAIILDPDGVVHRVTVGNYLGANIGKIINIYEDRVELREIVQDNNGRWEERKAALTLIEE